MGGDLFAYVTNEGRYVSRFSAFTVMRRPSVGVTYRTDEVLYPAAGILDATIQWVLEASVLGESATDENL